MKKILIILFSIIIFSAQAQTLKKCYTPISNYQFQQKYNTIVAQKYEAQKLSSAKNIAKGNCLSSAQVKQIAALFENDYNRLEFAEIAYLSTTDKSNFYEVYDSFAYFSTVFRLHDYIKGLDGETKPNDDDNGPVKINFPNYNYPRYSDYIGTTSCNSVVSENTFLTQAKSMAYAKSESSKLALGKNMVKYYCLSTAQIMKITSLLAVESNRLVLAKIAYNRVYDKGNYQYITQLFKYELNRADILKYINYKPDGDIQTECKVSDKDMTTIKAEIKKQSFSNTRMTLAKQIIKVKKCFTTNQIIEILKLFSYDSSKIELAKYGYDYVTDKDNYYKTASILRYDFDRQSLLEYIKNK